MARRPRTLRPFERVVTVCVVVVVVSELFGEAKLATTDVKDWMLRAKEFCLHPTNITCELQPNNGVGTCKVYSVPEDNVYQNWKCTEIAENHLLKEIDEENNVTRLDILKCKENMLLLRTVFEKEKWLQINLPSGEHNLTLTLPGQLHQTIDVMKPRLDIGCNFHIYGISFRNLHSFELHITDERQQSIIPTVEVRIYSTNETNWRPEDCFQEGLNISGETNGSMTDVLTVRGIYSLTHCLIIKVNYSHAERRRYICLLTENMTAYLDELPQASLDVPVWWTVSLAGLIFCLILVSLAPLAIHKGLLRSPRQGFSRSVQSRCNGTHYCREREPNQFPESVPFFGDSSFSTAAHLAHSEK